MGCDVIEEMEKNEQEIEREKKRENSKEQT